MDMVFVQHLKRAHVLQTILVPIVPYPYVIILRQTILQFAPITEHASLQIRVPAMKDIRVIVVKFPFAMES